MDSGIAIAALAKRKRRFRIERKRPFAPSGTAHLHLYTAGVRRSEWKQKIRFTFRPDFAIITPAEYAPVAQLDRVTDSDSVGQRFESARAYHKKPAVRQVFLLCAADSRFIPGRGNPLGRTTKKPAVRQVFLLCAADSRFIPGRGNPLGRTKKKPVVSMATWFFFAVVAVKNQAQFRLLSAIKCPVMLHQCCTKNGSPSVRKYTGLRVLRDW